MDLFFEIHKDLPREAPGDDASTRRAYGMLPRLPKEPSILDMGCGPGAQTLELARISGGTITALDLHEPFLADLERRADAAGLGDRITTHLKPMQDPGLPDRSFDLIWSEGAIYIIGFEEGLRAWRRLLKPGGAIAVTEISWLKPNPPREVAETWSTWYPGMASIEENLKRITRQGYRVLGHFTLPESAWWEPYYNPILKRIERLRAQYARDAAVLKQLDAEQLEIDLYRRYAEWYGYEFYVAQLA